MFDPIHELEEEQSVFIFDLQVDIALHKLFRISRAKVVLIHVAQFNLNQGG